MGKEIERKFLVNLEKKSIRANENIINFEHIEQAYIATTENEEVRLRSKKKLELEEFFLTVKAGEGLVRSEFEAPISRELYEKMLASSETKPLVKERITILENGHKIEVDIYRDFSFITAEVEFESEELSRDYKIPSWFGEELTEDKKYKNKNLWKSLQK